MSSNTHILLRFLRWYFVREPLRLTRGYFAYMKALFEIVPFGFLVLTLLKPWKNIVDRKTEYGINLQRIIERMSLGLLARGTGCIVRLFTITLGLLFHMLLLAGTALYIVCWLSAPVWITLLVLQIPGHIAQS